MSWGRLLLLVIGLGGNLAIAHDDPHGQCDHKIFGKIEIVTSGRDPRQLTDISQAAQELTELAAKLGYATPNHRLTFVPSPMMNWLASVGRYALPHWHDGHQIMTQARSAGGVLEFVTSGCDLCRSYYNDTTSFEEQLSVIMHVLGHNDVSSHNPYMLKSQFDPMQAALEMAQKIEQLYRTYDHDEVSLFVQYLFTLEHMQDFAYGSVDVPESFRPQEGLPERIQFSGKLPSKSQYEPKRHPYKETPNLFQAFVHNLSPQAPAWKHELIAMHEKIVRHYVGNIQTKIMNEGWATFSQFLIARHSRFTTDQEALTFGRLLSGVARPKLDNPYFLGLESWWRLWERFKDREEVRTLSPFEQDQKFVQYAHAILESNDDYTFIDLALDQHWFDQKRLFLYRDLRQGDKLRTPPSGEGPHAVVLSRDRKRLIRYIQRRVVAKHLVFPRVKVTDFNWQQRGIVHLEQENIEGIPLERVSAIQSLFVLSQILERPVALSTFKGVPVRRGFGAPVQSGNTPILILVEPSGSVQVSNGSSGESDGLLSEETAQAKTIIEAYQESVRGVLNEDLVRAKLDPSWQSLVHTAMDQQFQATRDLVFAAPYASHAVSEVTKILNERLVAEMRKIIRSGRTPKMSKSGIGIRIFPPIPGFQYDRQAKAQIMQSRPPAPLDPAVGQPVLGEAPQDDSSTLGSALHLPGDVFKKPKGGQGGGQGQGEGEEGDGQPTNPADEPAAPGSNGDADVFVDAEFWGKMLADELKLPNIRRTNGASEEMRRVRRGAVHRPSGFEIEELTMQNAIQKAIGLRKLHGQPYRLGPDLTRRQLLTEAAKYLDDEDVMVSHHIQLPMPDFEAVLVVVGDLTGSMAGQRAELAKQLIFNIQALLKANYKRITIRYVGFSDDATEVPEKDFFSKFIGGGTNYYRGLEEGKKILDQYSNATHNKYVLLVGDAEYTDDGRVARLMTEFSKELQYFSFAVTDGGNNGFSFGDPFVALFEGFKQTWPYVGVARVRSEGDVIPSLKLLFPHDQ